MSVTAKNRGASGVLTVSENVTLYVLAELGAAAVMRGRAALVPKMPCGER